MTIWMVNTGMENSCAWSNKRDAIQYLKEEAEDCEWELLGPLGSEETDPVKDENDLHYIARYKTNPYFQIKIERFFLDEKPYFYP